jgi:tight adherence protein B
VTLLAALVVGALVFGAVHVLLGGARRRDDLKRRVSWYGGSAGPQSSSESRSVSHRLRDATDRVLEKVGLLGRLSLALGQAGMDRSPAGFAGLVVAVAAAAGFLGFVVVGPLAALLGVLATPAVAVSVLVSRAKRRATAFEAQLPELLDAIAASLKAGHSFDHALQNVADDSAEPAATELKRVLAEVHLGRTLEAALADLGQRVRSDDLLFVLDAISVQRQVGGSLAELFAIVAETVRHREQFRRKLRAITGMARISAKILSALPLVVAGALLVVNPSYLAPLVTMQAGRIMIALTIVMIGIGTWVLRKIGTVEP